MGLLGKLFGGGTDLSVALHSTNVIAGGTVAGKLTVTGGKKPLTMTSLVVRVFYVHVTASADSPLPKVDLRQLVDITVVANQPLPPGKVQTYDFAVQLPDGLDPKGRYKVVASADIPGVKDPSADAELKIIAPGAKRGGLLGKIFGASEQDLLGRYPGLMSQDHDELFSALCELRSDVYGDDAAQLVGLAPFLLGLVKTGPTNLRDQALETWSTLLNNRTRPSDIDELNALAAEPLTRELRKALATAATKFADEGAGPLLARLARDSDPEIREQVAHALHTDADDGMPGRLELAVELTRDGDVAVRTAAAATLTVFSDDPQAMQLAVELAGNDPSPEVRAAAIGALGSAHYSGMLELVVSTYQAHITSPSSEVRKAIAGRLASLPADDRVGHLVHALLSDRSAEVRKSMAWQGCNMSDHPGLAPLFRHVAENDPDDSVRADGVYGMRGFLADDDCVVYARQRLAQDPSQRMAWTVLSIANEHSQEASGRQLLTDLTRSPYADVASSARASLED
jgi:HEAT repeat protein